MDRTKDFHDLLVSVKPEGASHDPDTCSICRASDDTGDDMADKTYTEAEHADAIASAVADAVKPLNDKIEQITKSQETAEVDAKIAEATQELTEKLATAEAERDTAVIERDGAQQAAADLTAYLEGVAAEQAAEAETAQRKDERIVAVAEVANFAPEYVEKNAERWASMEDEAFKALLDDYAAAGAKPAPKGNDTVPTQTALTASRETAGATDAVKEVIRLRDLRVDPRHI